MDRLHIREAPRQEDVQHRFYELRFDEEERRVTGTAMRYGDVAELPWGEKEKFDAGAFGDTDRLDATLNVQHDRGRPVARTGGGGLKLRDTGGALEIDAVLPDTTDANDAVKNIRARILRGLSVEFWPETTRLENGVTVIEKAVLRGIAIVDRPAYNDSKLQPREQPDMDEKAITELVKRAVEDALKTRAEGAPVDSGAIGTAVATALAERFKDLPTAESVQASIDSALKARDEAEEARQKAERERAEAEAKAKEDREQAEKDAETRADLLMTVKPLLPEGTEVRGKSNHELLVLAAGDEVPGAKDRSEDYLLAKIEDIAKRREAANGGPAPAPNGGGNGGAPRVYGGPGFSIAGAVDQRAAQRAAQRRA